MSRKIIGAFLAVALTVVTLAGCGSSSGVSQEEYDKLAAELEAMKNNNGDSGTTTTTTTTEEKTETAPAETPTQDQTTTAGNSVKLQTKGSDSSDSSAAASYEEIELVDSTYKCYSSSGKYRYVSYVVTIKNPNKDAAVKYPKIKITAKDADGMILKSDEMTLNCIAADDTIIYANEVLYEGAEAATVDISVSNKDDYYIPQDDSKFVKQSAFEFGNASEQGGSWKKITGELTNNSDVDFDTVAVTVVYSKNGERIGGATGYAKDVDAHATTVFEVSGAHYIDDYDNIELYAIQW